MKTLKWLQIRSIKFLLTGVIMAFLSLWCSVSVPSAKDYSIRSVIIDAQLDQSGNMSITEKRTYDFSGTFHWATYTMPTGNTGGVVDFSVGEEGHPYSRNPDGSAGTYTYEENPGSIYTKWFFDAQNGTRTFILSYRILDVVRAYRDAAVLYYKFVGSGWDKPSGEVAVTIQAPKEITGDQVKAWAHGPLWGTVQISENGTVKAQITDLPRNTFWEVRVLYPVSYFPRIRDISPEPAVPTILAEEKRWADEANAQRREWINKQQEKNTQKKYGFWVVLILSGVGFLMVGSLYHRYGRKHRTPFPDTFYSDIPSDLSPALLSYLLSRSQIGGSALVGTMLDLAQRGFLKIKENESPAKFLFWSFQNRNYMLELDRKFYSENKKSLQPFETDLLIFIFDDLAGGQDTIDFKTIRKSRSRFIGWFRNWKKEVVKMGMAKGYWDITSLKARNKGVIIGLVLLVLTVISAIFIEEWAIIPGISGAVLLIWSWFIPRRTPEFELEAKKWGGLKKYLRMYQFRDSTSPFFLENISKLLIYGVVLGLSKEVVKKMAAMVPQGQQSSFFPWYVATHPHGDFSPAGFGDALSSLMTAASSTMSSASGTGGGASGGGGGGAGGSGGGAG
jgi:uncharacterized membrane protein